MDKETLSNYGWIVICVLVLAVMIALATPFGNFVANAVKSTTKGLFSASQNALNSVSLPGLNIEDQEFDSTHKNPNDATEEIVTGSATFDVDGGLETLDWETFLSCGETYCYEVYTENNELNGYVSGSSIAKMVVPEGITKIGEGFFSECCDLTSVTLPSTITTIGGNAFGYNGQYNYECNSTNIEIHFNGTMEMWKQIDFGSEWSKSSSLIIICTDGMICSFCNEQTTDATVCSNCNTCIVHTRCTHPDICKHNWCEHTNKYEREFELGKEEYEKWYCPDCDNNVSDLYTCTICNIQDPDIQHCNDCGLTTSAVNMHCCFSCIVCKYEYVN